MGLPRGGCGSAAGLLWDWRVMVVAGGGAAMGLPRDGCGSAVRGCRESAVRGCCGNAAGLPWDCRVVAVGVGGAALGLPLLVLCEHCAIVSNSCQGCAG